MTTGSEYREAVVAWRGIGPQMAATIAGSLERRALAELTPDYERTALAAAARLLRILRAGQE